MAKPMIRVFQENNVVRNKLNIVQCINQLVVQGLVSIQPLNLNKINPFISPPVWNKTGPIFAD